jgi:NO-binding membrane sensor protein with MHYT domain
MNSIVVGQALVPHYQWAGVGISYLVSVLGSFAALQCARHMFDAKGRLDWGMAVGAACALGGIGIWSMHFIGMLAYRPGVPVSYEVIPTALSLIAAIVISGIALYLTGSHGRFSVKGWIAGSLLAGAGVCVMHYMGMYAMNMRADMNWDLQVVGESVVIAVVAATAALWLAFKLKRLSHQFAGALVMGLAVCAMHYTGMSSVSLICTAQPPAGTWLFGNSYLDLIVFATASLALVTIYWAVTGRSVHHQGSSRRTRRAAPGAAAQQR